MPSFPDENEEKAFYDQSGDARTMTRRLVSLIENRLANILRTRLRADDAALNAMLGNAGYLQSFEAKILIAYLIRAIQPDLYRDLLTLNQLLNLLIPQVEPISFDNSEVANLIEKLHALRVYRELYESKADRWSSATATERTRTFILQNELADRRSQLRLCVRFYLDLLAKEDRSSHESQGTADTKKNSFVSEYPKKVANFETLTLAACRISHHSGDRRADGKAWWATVLFTRLCTIAVSILKITPHSSYFDRNLDNWDFGSVAALVRNVLECYFTFFYLSVEEVPDEEWKARITIMHLRDNISRLDLFRALDPNVDSSGYDKHTADLHSRLASNTFFMSLPEKQRLHFLKGQSALMLSQDEILLRMKEDVPNFRAMYRLFSAHVHSTPLAFYRTGEKDRGRGLENEVEKAYIGIALDFVSHYVQRGSRELVTIFPDLAQFLRSTTE